MTPTTLPRHARPLAPRRWTGRLVQRGLVRPLAGAAPPRPPARRDPLAGPVAITEHCVIGDQIRVPAARCDMAGCQARFADPGALGETDNRARALAVGWHADTFGRLVCPACQQRHDLTWPRPVPGHEPDDAGAPASAVAPPGPGDGPSRYVQAMMARWHSAVSPGRHRRTQRPPLLAALPSDGNGCNTPPPVTVPAPAKDRTRPTTLQSANPQRVPQGHHPG